VALVYLRVVQENKSESHAGERQGREMLSITSPLSVPVPGTVMALVPRIAKILVSVSK